MRVLTTVWLCVVSTEQFQRQTKQRKVFTTLYCKPLFLHQIIYPLKRRVHSRRAHEMRWVSITSAQLSVSLISLPPNKEYSHSTSHSICIKLMFPLESKRYITLCFWCEIHNISDNSVSTVSASAWSKINFSYA